MENNASPSADDNEEIRSDSEDNLFIRRDSLVRVNCKRGKSVATEYYRILAFFSKFYNKWWMARESEFPWTNSKSDKQGNRILARLARKVGSSYQEVDLKADGEWAPKQVYRIVPFSEIIFVENKLIGM